MSLFRAYHSVFWLILVLVVCSVGLPKKVQLAFMMHVADFYNPCKFRQFKYYLRMGEGILTDVFNMNSFFV